MLGHKSKSTIINAKQPILQSHRNEEKSTMKSRTSALCTGIQAQQFKHNNEFESQQQRIGGEQFKK
jgi:hypothetical protein